MTQARIAERLLGLSIEDEDARFDGLVGVVVDHPAVALDLARRWLLLEEVRRSLAVELLLRFASHPELEWQRAVTPDIQALFESRHTGLVPDQLAASVIALGQLNQCDAFDAIGELASHGNAIVRHAVAYSLPSLMSGCEEHGGADLGPLIRLADDPDSDVRDWALFGLGQILEANSPEAVLAFERHLDDEDDDARYEAHVGLALTGDVTSIRIILETQADPPLEVVEAAAASGEASLRSALLALSTRGWIGTPSALQEAIDRCSAG